MNSVALRLGVRYACGKQRSRFGGLVSAFALAGMAVGVAALIIVLAVMNGFEREIAQRFLRVTPHLSLLPVAGDLGATGAADLDWADYPQVRAWAPFLESHALLIGGRAQVPVRLQGIEPALDAAVVDLPATMLYGRPAELQPGRFALLLGAQLARQLEVAPGESLQLALPQVQVTPAGIYPRQKTVTVAGVFQSGSQKDAELAFVHFEDARTLLRAGAADNGWRLRLDSVDSVAAVGGRLAAQGGWQVYDWRANYESLFRAMRMEKVTVAVLLGVIILVAAFNIVSGLVMIVADKRAAMAVLCALGAGRGTVVRIFMIQGLVLGVAGIVIGGVGGSLVAVYLPEMVAFFEALFGGNVFDPQVFYVRSVPAEWRLGDFLRVVGAALVLTFLATLGPAWQAAQIVPSEALDGK